MAEFKAKTADGRGLTFDISGPSPTPQEQAEINAHIQNYNRLFPTYTQAAPVPAEEELGPWGAGWRGLYADTQSVAAGILQGLGAPEMAQRFEEDANRVRRETAERYKPLAFSDINNLSDVGTFAYQAGVGSLPYMIPGLIGGGIAGLGARALGGAAATYAPAAAAAGYAGATAPTRIGGIASRMAEEQGTTLSQIDWGKAVATGAASTALDLVTPQVLGVFGKFAGAAKVGDEIATGAINSWWKSLPKNVIKAAGTEAGTETAQQAMEIWAANPEKFYELGPDVREELITAAVAGGLLGPIFEVATGGFAAEQSALAKAREKRRKAQEALDALIVQGDAANAEQIRQLREDYSKALAEEKAFSESDQADVPFGPDTPRYRPSDDMGRYRAEVIVSDQGTPAGYRVAGPTGESIAEDYPSFDAARMAAQVLNDSAPHSPSIMESYPVIPTSSLSASTREALVKKRFELGQAGLEANTSMTEIRNLLGDAIATLERERLTGSPDIPLQARMVAQSSPASTSVTPNIPPPAAPASAPAPTPAAPAVAPTVAPEKKKAAKTLKPRTKVVKAPVEVNPETATPTPQQPSAVPTEPDLNAMTDDELEAYLAEGAGEFTFRPGELGQQEDPDFARRKRGKQAAEATVNAAEQRPAPTGPRFTVQPIDATVAAPEGVPSGTLFEIFKDGKVIGSSSDLAQAQERARKILQKSPTASVRVRPKGRAYAVNEYRGSANGDVFVSTVRTFRDKAEADTYADTLNKMREERAQKRATNRAIIKRYEDLVAKQQAVVQRLMNRLRDLGMPENFRLLIRGVLQDPTKAVEDINIDAAGDTGIEGYYDAAAKTIAFAMDLYDPNLNEDQLYAKLAGVINHEFVHALQRAGSFTPAEWKVITKYLKSNQAYGRDGEKIPGQTWWERAEQMYGAQDQERVAREAMSEAFRSWARERKSVTGKPAGIFRRIVEMLKSLGRFGKTTPRVEQIFTEINAGKRSSVLKQDVLATQEAPDFSRRVSNIIDMTERRQAQIEEQFDREDADMIANMSVSGLARADAIILKHADLIRSLSAKLDLHYALSKYLPIGYTLAPRADTGPIEDVITDVVANDAVHKIMSGDISYSDMIESARQYGVNLRIDDPTRIPYDPGRRPGLRSLENQDAADSVGSSFKDKVASLDAGLDEARMLLPGKPKKWYRENNVMLGSIETDPGFAEAFKKYDDFVVGEKRKAIKLVVPEKAIDFSGRKVTPASFFDMKELAGWVEEAEARPSQTAIVKMTPDQFLDLATHGARDRAYFDKYAEKIDRGMKLSSVMSLRLKVESDGTLRIEGHEGRHRANAIKRLGYDEVPVKIFLTSDQAKVHNISEILSAPVKVIGQPPMTNEVDLDLRPFTRDDLQAAAVEPLRLSVGIAPIQTRIGLEKDQSPEALSRLVESGSDDARAQSRAVTEAMKEFSRPIAEAAKKGGARVYNTAGVGAYMNYDAEVSSGVAAVYDPDTKVSAINDVVAETFRLAREHDQYDAFVAINRGPSFSGPSARPSMTIWLNTQAGFDNHNRDVTSLTRIRDFLSRVRTENVAGFSIFQTQAQRGIEGGYEGITFVWVPEYANVTPENFDQNLVDTIREMDEVAKAIKDLNLGSITYTNYELILGSSTGPDSYETAAAGFIRDSANAGNFGEGRPVGRSVRDSVARRAQGVEQAQPSDNVGSVPARGELDEQALEDARAKYDVPAEVKKPNGDIDFSKRNLTLVPIEIKKRKYRSEAEFSVKMVGSDKEIGELRGHVSSKKPNTFQVDWASFDPDDMTIPETYGLIGLLLKHFPNVRRIVGYRISGAKFENRARRIRVARAVAERAQVRFVENIMMRAEASSNPVERSFFKRYLGASPDLIYDTASRQVPELFDELNESKIAYLDASGVLFQLQLMDQTQVIDVGRLIDRGAIDFSRRLVNTPEFKAWFKDSKVVNPDGSPKIVFHNTAASEDFSSFRTSSHSFGAHFGTPIQANYFGKARNYIDNRILPVFLSIQNPVRVGDLGAWPVFTVLRELKKAGAISESDLENIHKTIPAQIQSGVSDPEASVTDMYSPLMIAAQRELIKLGIDGLVYLNRVEGLSAYSLDKANEAAGNLGRELTDDEFRALVPEARDSYIAFRPTQIKSALSNRGTFSSEDPRIDFSRRKAVIKLVEKKKVEKLSRDERMEALAENFKRRPDLFEVASNVYGETLYIKKEITNAVPGIHDIIPFLRPDEIGLTNAKGAQSIMEMFTTVPSTEEMAAVAISGRAKRGWYERSAKALIDIFGPKDAPRFSALLAAMSPQSSVESNAKNAINMWVNWDRAGRPTDTKRILQIMGKSVQGKKGEKSALDSWKPNTLTALQTIDPHAITISGNKVNSFMLNLNDVVHAVTNDAWMANYGGVAQDKFTGPSYHGYSAKVRMAADTATQITGYKWTPREIQETIWSWSKTIYELRKKRGKGGGNETVGDLLKAGNVTNDMISKTPDFATLFADGVYRNILESGGYGTQIERIMSDERIEGRGGQADVALGDASIYDAEGTGIDERTYRRFLDTAAGRLEALYQRRKAEAAAKRARGEKLSEDGDDAEIDYSRRVTSTLEFQDWFGLSKVVDANGDPIIVYHGTSKDNDFSAFNIPRNGAWFTASPDEASAYAKENDSRKLVLGEGFRYIEKNTADRVLPVYLRIENPYKFTDADRDSLNNQPDRRDTGTAYRRWQAEFFDKLRREGYDGVDMGYGTWVVIGEPNQIKSAIGNNGKFDPTKKRIDYSRRTMPVTPADIANAVDRLRYTKVRNGIARALRGVTIAGKRIGLSDEAAMGTSRSFLENFADHALPLGEIVDFVRENKGSIPDAFDAYLAQQVWSSEATDHINRMNDRLYNPLVRSIQNIKISDAEYNDFKKRFPSLAKVVEVAGDRRLGMLNALLYARHAPERNVIMNIMNEGNLPAGSGVPTPEAEAATKWFESRGDWPKYRQAEGIIRQIVEETNKIRVEYGLTPDFKNIPPPEVFKKAGMPGGYKFYVPLRGMIEEDMMPNDIDLQRLRTGLGFKIKGKEDMTAMGRDTLAKSVAEHVILQNEVSIVRAHKNKVGRSFYDLVANNQNILLGIARIVEKAPLVRRVGDDGIVRLMVDPNYMNSDRFFVTKINGENKVVEIFDKRLARTLNGSTGYGSDAANQIINFIGGFTRLMSQLATGLNPEFWIRNTPRDVALAAVNLNQFEIPGLDATFMRNWPVAFKTARRANRFDWNFVKAGEERVPSGAEPDDILYNEFLEDGGFTGYLGLQSIETRIADLNKQITKGEAQGLQKGLEVGKRFAQFVEAINNTFENSTRFAVYKSLRESGFTRQRAAQGAKTITTNFNAGGWLKNMINPFYMFYNASLQGTLGILTALGRSKRVQKIAGSIMIAGFLQDLLMASLSDEDDTGALKYDGLKEHILRTHMVFADPTGMSGDGYIKVPMPYGYNAIFNFGRVVAKYIRHQATGGDYDLGKAIGSAVGTLADATNPLGATNSFMNFAAPTFLDPVVDLTTNRDFADRTIVKRPFGVGVDLPSSQLHLNSTSPTFVSIAEWLNSVSGGTDVMPGAIDFSPDAMQYLYDYFLSGAGAFVRRSFDLTTQGLPAALQGDFDAIQMSEVPMARALITRPAKVDMERYMEIRDEVMRIGKEAQEASRQSDMQRLENVREKYQKQLQVYGVVKAADSQRASINKRLAAIRENEKLTPEAKTNLIKQLKDQEEAAMIRAIRAYNFTVEGMSVPGMEQ